MSTPRHAAAVALAAAFVSGAAQAVTFTTFGFATQATTSGAYGGINGNFNDNFGIRGDIRYFRSLQDNEPDNDLDLNLGSFDFWRGTVGLTFRW